MFPVKPLTLAAVAVLLGCVSVTGPCGVTIRAIDAGERSASIECDPGGGATILAPARTINAVVRAASEGSP